MSIINKCLFPVAGYGTRFLPATKAIPKEMLPILTKPLIQYGVEEAMSAGMTTMAMVTSKYKQAIKNHFEPHGDIEASVKGTAKAALLDEVNHASQQCDFSYIEQDQMLGLGHAIYTGKLLIGNEPFAVILPDDLCTSDGDSVLTQMTKLYQQHPDHPEIFNVLESTAPDKNGEIQITDALMTLAKQGKVIAYKFQGTRFDCGSVKGFVVATNAFAKQQNII